MCQGKLASFTSDENVIMISQRLGLDLNTKSFKSGSKNYKIDPVSLKQYFIQDMDNNKFTIQTKKNEYICNSLGILSSSLIREIITKEPKTDRYLFDFEDENNEFQFFCDLFNFEEISLTNSNAEIIREIAESLRIDCIFAKIEEFTVYSEKASNLIDDQKDLIDSIDEVFDLLYNIKERTVDSVADLIKNSIWSKTENNIIELAAFINQVISSDINLHPYIIELLINLNDEKDHKLKILLPFIINHSKNMMIQLSEDKQFDNNSLIFPFVYKMHQKGIISKEELNNTLNNCKLSNSYFVSWFLPELIELRPVLKDLLSSSAKTAKRGFGTGAVATKGGFGTGALATKGGFGTGAVATKGGFGTGAMPAKGGFGTGAVATKGGFGTGAVATKGGFGTGAMPAKGGFGTGAVATKSSFGTGTVATKSGFVTGAMPAKGGFGTGTVATKSGFGTGTVATKSGFGTGAVATKSGFGTGTVATKGGFGTGAVYSKTAKTSFGAGNNISLIYPSSLDKIEEFKRMREKGECDDDISKALRDDDVDSFQSIISKSGGDDLLKGQISANLFEPFFSSSIRFINYAAAYGSVKCFKYLLLNNEQVDELTFKMSVIGGNHEIIRIVDNEKVEPELPKNGYTLGKGSFSLGKGRLNPFTTILDFSIRSHKNSIFDWLLEQKSSNFKDTDFIDLVDCSIRTGNIYTLIQLIDTNVTLNNYREHFNNFFELSSQYGFYQLTKLLFKIIESDSTTEKINVNPKCVTNFDNVLLFQLFENEMNQVTLEDSLIAAIQSNSIRIIKYYFETLINTKFTFNSSNNMFILPNVFKYYSDSTFDYIMKVVYEKYELTNKDSFDLLEEGFYFRRIEGSIKLAQFIYDKNQETDFTDAIIGAIKHNLKEIVEDFLSKKYVINYEKLANELDNLDNIDVKIFELFKIDDNIKKSMTNCINSAIIKQNKPLFEYLLKEGYPYDNSLITAALVNDLDIVETILNKNSSLSFVNKISEYGTALLASIQQGNLSIFKRLISIPGIDPSLFINKDHTCLIDSISGLHEEIVDLLFEFYGENIVKFKDQFEKAINNISQAQNIKPYEPILLKIIKLNCVDPNLQLVNSTLLNLACQINSIEIANILLQYETIDVNLPAPINLNTPLITSIQFHSFEITKLLLDHPKININQKNFVGETAFLFSVYSDSIDICSFLFQHKDFKMEENNLNLAFYKSSPNIAKQLLTIQTVDVNYVPLNSPDIFKKVSKIKSSWGGKWGNKSVNNVNNANNANTGIIKTSLIKAIENDDHELFDLIVNHPSFKINRYHIIDAILVTFYQNKIEFFDKLIQLAEQIDININSTILNGNSPLVEAVLLKSSNEMILNILNNPNFDSRKSDIDKAFHISYPKVRISVEKRVFERENIKKKGFGMTSKFGGTTTFGGTAKFGGTTSFGKTSTFGGTTTATVSGPQKQHIKCQKELYALSEMLYDYDNKHDHLIDLNKIDANGISVFEHSIQDSSNTFPQLIIDSHKIDFNKLLPNGSNRSTYTTYLHILIKYSIDNTLIERILKEKLCDINITDSKGETPLMCACKLNKSDTIKLLFNFDDLDFLHLNNDGKDALQISKYNGIKNNQGNEDQEQDDDKNKIVDKNEYLSELLKFSSNRDVRAHTPYGGAFGARTTGAFGTRTTGAFGAKTTGAFGAKTTGAFGTKTTGAFGTKTTSTTSNFGTSTANKFGTSTTSNFGTNTASKFATKTTNNSELGKEEIEQNKANQTPENEQPETTSKFGSNTTSKFGSNATSKFGSNATSKFGSNTTSKFGSNATSKFGSNTTSKFGSNTTSKFGLRKAEIVQDETNQTPENEQPETASKFGSNTTSKFGSNTTSKFGLRKAAIDQEEVNQTPENHTSFIPTTTNSQQQDQTNSKITHKTTNISPPPPSSSQFNSNLHKYQQQEPEIKQKPQIRSRRRNKINIFQDEDEEEEIEMEDDYPRRRRRLHSRYYQQMQLQQPLPFPDPNQMLILRQQQEQWIQLINMNNAFQAQLSMHLYNQNKPKKKRRSKSAK